MRTECSGLCVVKGSSNLTVSGGQIKLVTCAGAGDAGESCARPCVGEVYALVVGTSTRCHEAFLPWTEGNSLHRSPVYPSVFLRAGIKVLMSSSGVRTSSCAASAPDTLSASLILSV